MSMNLSVRPPYRGAEKPPTLQQTPTNVTYDILSHKTRSAQIAAYVNWFIMRSGDTLIYWSGEHVKDVLDYMSKYPQASFEAT